MATNLYFNNYFSSQEQQLIDDLVTESIKQYGIDAYYLPRSAGVRSDVFRELQYTVFDKAIELEIYIKNIDGFSGDGKFLSKFGLEIRDSITFTISRTAFAREVGSNNYEIRPNEGDLIYFPLNQKLFQIKFVNHEIVFYQLGSLQMYDVECELFEFTNEIFNCGLPDVDLKYNAYNFDTDTNLILDTSNEVLLTTDNYGLATAEYRLQDIDPDAMNETFDSLEDGIIDFSEQNPFSEQGSV